jgi:hypothetical protein
MIDTYTMIYLASSLSVVFACVGLSAYGVKLLRQSMVADAAAAAVASSAK